MWDLRTQMHLGTGADRLRTEVEGYGDVGTLVDGGQGDDDMSDRLPHSLWYGRAAIFVAEHEAANCLRRAEMRRSPRRCDC
jgi:hypothetical protein